MRQNATHSGKSPRYTGAPSSPSDLLTIDQRSRSKCGRVTQDHPASNFTITRKMQQNATKCNTFRKKRSRIISLCGLHQVVQRFPSLQIAGLLLLTVLLVILLPIALYVSIAGGSVSIPMVFYGLRINRVHRSRPGQPTTFIIRHRKLFGGSIGPDLDDRGYENIGSMDYPLLPAGVDIYRRSGDPCLPKHLSFRTQRSEVRNPKSSSHQTRPIYNTHHFLFSPPPAVSATSAVDQSRE